jgi:hypothetical protein
MKYSTLLFLFTILFFSCNKENENRFEQKSEFSKLKGNWKVDSVYQRYIKCSSVESKYITVIQNNQQILECSKINPWCGSDACITYDTSRMNYQLKLQIYDYHCLGQSVEYKEHIHISEYPSGSHLFSDIINKKQEWKSAKNNEFYLNITDHHEQNDKYKIVSLEENSMEVVYESPQGTALGEQVSWYKYYRFVRED